MDRVGYAQLALTAVVAAVVSVVVTGQAEQRRKLRELDKVKEQRLRQERENENEQQQRLAVSISAGTKAVAREDTDEREYKIKRNGNFTAAADPSMRSRAWFKHPTWYNIYAFSLNSLAATHCFTHSHLSLRHIPSLEREKINVFTGIDNILCILNFYNVSSHRGFLPEVDPLQRLPHEQ